MGWWEDATAAWDSVMATADAAVKAAWQEAQDAWASLIEADPEAYEPQVAAFHEELERTRALLSAMAPRLPPTPAATAEDQAVVDQYAALQRRYDELAAPFYADARPAQAPAPGPVGFVGIALAAAGIVVGLAGAAWAVPGYQYATNLREQTELAARELDARVAASQDGRTLQSSTLPEPEAPADPGKAAGRLGVVLLGGAAAVAGVVFFLKRS